VKDAFGVERSEVSKVSLKFLRPAAKAAAKVGDGPGAMKVPGTKVAAKPTPAPPYGGFVTYDPGLRAQQARGAMKATFGKSAPKGMLKLNPITMENETAHAYVAGKQRAHAMGRAAGRVLGEVKRANPGVPKQHLPDSPALARSEKLADSGDRAARVATDAKDNMNWRARKPTPERSKRFQDLAYRVPRRNLS
jgi:hypothetical protein